MSVANAATNPQTTGHTYAQETQDRKEWSRPSEPKDTTRIGRRPNSSIRPRIIDSCRSLLAHHRSSRRIRQRRLRLVAGQSLEHRTLLAAGISFDFTTYAGAHDATRTVHGGPSPQTSPNTIIYYGHGSVTGLTDLPNTLAAAGGAPLNLTFEFGSSNAAAFEEVVSLNVFDDGVADGTANQNYTPDGVLEVGGTKPDNPAFRIFNSGTLVATGNVQSLDLEVSPGFITTSSMSILQLDPSPPPSADPTIYNELVAVSSGASGQIPFSLGAFNHEGVATGFTNVQEFSSIGQVSFPDPTGTVSGTKFEDRNANGARDAGEPGLSGWTIFVDTNSNGVLDSGELNDTTDGNGEYTISGVPTGTIDLVEVQQAGWTASLPASVAGTIDEPNPPVLPRTGTSNTTVSTDITANTTWTKAAGPYLITNPLDVRPGVTLTIEPGVEVLFAAGAQLVVVGQLDAIGTVAEPILFTSAALTPAANDWNGIYVFDAAGAEANLQFATVEYAGTAINARSTLTLADSILRNNTTGLYGDASTRTEVDRTVFSNNQRGLSWARHNVRDSLFVNNDYGIYEGIQTDVSGSVFRANTVGLNGARDLIVRNSKIESNTTGVHQYFNAGPSLYNNEISFNTIGAVLGSGRNDSIVLEGNAFHDNSTLNLQTQGANDKHIPGNYWGATVAASIDAAIEDARDNLSLGLVNYEPILATMPAIAASVPGHISVTIANGVTTTDADFGNYRPGAINGDVFDDPNGNGAADTGESGLQGVTIFIDANDNGQLDNTELRSISASDGTYSFTGLGPGTYRLRELSQSGWTTTLPALGFVDVTVESGQTVTDVAFGNHEPGRPDPVQIHGVKFNDLDADGVKDAGEPGLSGWTIYLDLNGNRKRDSGEPSTTTAGDGSYSFTNLAAGSYSVGEVEQSNWQQSFPVPESPVPPAEPATTTIDHSSVTAVTTVSGGIFEDTTWEVTDSPIRVTSDVLVFPDTTLTIEPGVVVLFDSGTRLTIRGHLNAIGTDVDPILLTSSSATPAMNDWNGIQLENTIGGTAELSFVSLEYANTAFQVSCCTNSIVPATISDSTFRHNSLVFGGYSGGDVEVYRSLFENNTTVSGSADRTIYDSIFRNNVTVLYDAARHTIVNSLFENNDVAVSAHASTRVEYSTITGNRIGVTAPAFNGPNLHYNTIAANEIGIELTSQFSTAIATNNIFDNTVFNAQNLSASDRNLAGNFWGTQSALDISNSVHDSADDGALGTVTVDPYLLQELDTTPPAVGFHSVTLASGETVNAVDFGNFQKLSASFTTATATIDEDAGIIVVDAQLTEALPFDTSVPVTFTGTAVLNQDYAVTDAVLFFPAGETTGTMTLSIFDDARFENVDTITMTIESGVGVVAGSTPTKTISINDNDSAPGLSFFTAGTTAEESSGSVLVEARLTAESEIDVVAPLLFSGTATEGNDYTTGLSPTITIPAGALRGSLMVNITDDPTGEPAERIVVNFDTPTGATLSTNVGDPLTHVITIPQNDEPNVSFTASQGSFAENGGTRDITARLSNTASTDVVIPFTISHGTNADINDYDVSPVNSLTIPAGQTQGVITLTGTNDSVDESNERITVHMGSPTGAIPGTVRAFTGTIIDDDRAYVRLSSSGATVWENEGSRTVTVQLTKSSTSPVTVNLSQSGSASGTGSSRDYDLSTTSVTIPAGETSRTFTVDPRSDFTTERTEYGYVNIASVSSATGAIKDNRRSSYRLAIKDDDPNVYIGTGSNIRESGTTSTSITVRLTAASNRTITVPLHYRGSARRNRDYTGPSSVTFSPGQTRKTITVKAKQDSHDEYTESIKVSLGTPTNANTTSRLRRSTSFKIYDNDAAPTVYFTKSRQYLNEGDTAYVTVKLTRSSAKTIRVPIKLSKYTTAESNDHTFRNLTLTFKPGQTSKTIVIRTHNDSRREPYDKIQLYISSSLTNAKRPRGGTPYHRAYIRPSDGYGNTPVSSSKSQTGSLAVTNGPSNIGNVDASQLGFPGVDLSKFGTASTNAQPGTIAVRPGGGYLVGSTAFFDANFNGVADFLDINGNEIQDEGEPSEPVAITGADGRFELTIDAVFDQDGSEILEVTEGRFVVTGGTDGATLLPFVGQFSAVPGQFLVSSVSSTVQQLTSSGLSSEDANVRVIEAFDMPEGLELATLDLIDATVGGNHDAAVAFARSAEIFNTTVAAASLFSGTAGAPSKSLLVDLAYAEIASRITDAESTMDLSDAATVASLLEGIAFRTGITLSTDIVDGAGTLIADGNLAIRDLAVTTDLAFVQQIVRIEAVMQGIISDDLAAVAAGTKTIADVLTTYAGAALNTAIDAATIGDVIKPAIVVNDVVQIEGDNGDSTFDFVVSLLTPSIYPVSVQYETIGDSADEADGDYTSTTGTLNWAIGESGDRTVSVTVAGDTTSESDERFLLSLFNEQNAVLQRSAGTAFILNDDTLQHSATQTDGETENVFTLQLSEDQVVLVEDDDEAFEGFQTEPWTAVLQGQDDVDDTLFLDFGPDSYRSDVITFDGGGGSGFDTAIVSGGEFDTVTVSLSNTTDGQTVFDPADSDETVTLNWLGLEPFVFDTVVADMILELPPGITSAVLEDFDVADSVVPEVMRLYSPDGDFEEQIFPNPTGSLTIRGGNGADTITVASLDPAFAGTLTIDSDALGTDPVDVTVDTAINATGDISIDATSITVNQAITLADADIQLTATGALMLNADVTSANSTVTLSTGVSATLAQAVGNNSVVLDEGVFILADGGSITGSLIVADGATLAGNGVVAADVTIQSGGHLAPGESPGALSVASLNMQTGSQLDIEIDGPIAGQFDQVITGVGSGNVNIDTATLNVSLGVTPTVGEVYRIMNITGDVGSGETGSGFNALPDGATLTVDGVGFRITYSQSDDADVELTVLSVPPSAPINVSVTDAETVRPTIHWDASPTATSYGIWFINLAGGVVSGQSFLAGTSFTPDSDLSPGQYRAYVRSFNASGVSGWSTPVTFYSGTPQTVPEAPSGVGVTNAETPRPTIQWSPATGADSYGIWFINLAGGIVSGQSGLSVTSFTPGADLAPGNYRAYVRSFNSAGVSTWSTPVTFYSGASLAIPDAPQNVTVVNPETLRPTIQWDATAGATSYGIWFINLAGGVVAGESGLTNTTFIPDSDLSAGDTYRVYIRAFNSAGVSSWSNPMTFRAGPAETVPEAPAEVTATAIDTVRPTIQWTESVGATSYGIWFVNLAGGIVAGQSGLTERSFTPNSDLAAGNYRVWIRAINSAGVSDWSLPLNLSVASLSPEENAEHTLAEYIAASVEPALADLDQQIEAIANIEQRQPLVQSDPDAAQPRRYDQSLRSKHDDGPEPDIQTHDNPPRDLFSVSLSQLWNGADMDWLLFEADN